MQLAAFQTETEKGQFLWGEQYSRMVENPFLDLGNVPLKDH